MVWKCLGDDLYFKKLVYSQVPGLIFRGFKSTIPPKKKHTDIHLSLFMSKLPWWWGSKLPWWWASKLRTRAPTPHESRQILTFWLLFPSCATWHEHDLKDLHEMFGTMKNPKFSLEWWILQGNSAEKNLINTNKTRWHTLSIKWCNRFFGHYLNLHFTCGVMRDLVGEINNTVQNRQGYSAQRSFAYSHLFLKH